MIDDYGLTKMGAFYETFAEWSHDHYLIIIMIMIKFGIPLNFGKINAVKEDIATTEENAINLV